MKKCSPRKLIGTELAFFRKTFGRMEETSKSTFLRVVVVLHLESSFMPQKKWQQK
jgi:hypothetical protein